MIPTHWIPAEDYARSPWDMLDIRAGMQFMRHPLYVGLSAGTKEDYKRIAIPDPADWVQLKYQELLAAYEAKDIHRYVYLHERPFRLLALLDAEDWTERQDWFETAGDVWTDSEEPGINYDIWAQKVFTSTGSLLTMNVEERSFYDSLFEPITIYRGANTEKHAKKGLSWTLNRDKAIWFAKRYSRSPHSGWLATAIVTKKQIAAIFQRRGEDEVVVTKRIKNQMCINLGQ